jgi:hypothetical protein
VRKSATRGRLKAAAANTQSLDFEPHAGEVAQQSPASRQSHCLSRVIELDVKREDRSHGLSSGPSPRHGARHRFNPWRASILPIGDPDPLAIPILGVTVSAVRAGAAMIVARRTGPSVVPVVWAPVVIPPGRRRRWRGTSTPSVMVAGTGSIARARTVDTAS